MRPIVTGPWSPPDDTQTLTFSAALGGAGEAEVSGWQPINTAPKDCSLVDLWIVIPWNDYGERVPNCRWDDDKWQTLLSSRLLEEEWIDVFKKDDDFEATHWMPIPDGPGQRERLK